MFVLSVILHYEQTDCTANAKCSYVRFLRHPQQRMRSKCDENLMKAVKTASGKKIFVPLRVFCYKSIIDSIKNLVQRPGILDLFSKWKQRDTPDGVMSDVYDGDMWQSFLRTGDGKDLLSSRYTLSLILNVDWFQPYRRAVLGWCYLYISPKFSKAITLL